VTRVVVDASVLVACAISDGKARSTLLSASSVDFFAPAFVLDEFKRHIPKIIALSGVAPPILSALADDLVARVRTVSREGYASALARARKLVELAQATGDEDYVALAIALDAPIWTYDKDFRRVKTIRLISREEIEPLGRSTT